MFSLFGEGYTFIELFCGKAWTSRCMRVEPQHWVASLDITSPLLGPSLPDKQDAMDLSTDAGMASFG